MKRFLPYAFVGMLSISMPTMLRGGNIPQYKLSYENAEEFIHLENPTIVKSTFVKKALLFPDGKEHNDYAYTGPGFPIGFTFRLGGQDFTQFAIDNLGAIYLGTDEDGVVYRGMNSLMFTKALPNDRDLSDEFYLGMIIGGVLQEFRSGNKALGELKPQVGYSLLGEEGNRVLVVEYLNMAPEGEKASAAGHYDLQLRLYEADNHFEIAFNEVESTIKNYSFRTGVRGFEIEDGMLLTSSSLGKAPKISSYRYGDWDDPGSEGLWTVNWNGQDDFDNFYKPVYSFYPETDPTAPQDAPINLEVRQEEASAFVTLKRAENADATVVLYSESPFTEADFPVDGVTFRSQGKFGDYITTIGNATVLYYGNTENIELELPGIENSKDYYFVALSANGYPAFNRRNIASAVLSTSQAAPKRLEAKASGINKVKLSWEAEDPVIIAVSNWSKEYGSIPYEGQFGRPEADVKTGDELPGGGKVIYVGDASEFEWEDAPANIINYFGAWTVKDGRVSAIMTPAHVCAFPSIPYNAYIENFPTYIVPDIFDIKSSVNPEILSVYNRNGDDVRALHVSLSAGVPVEFYLPELDFDTEDTELKFEFALETFRGFADSDGGVPISQGNEAGHFDSGSLDVLVNDGSNTRVIESIKDYSGTMEGNGLGGFVSGTSTFDPVTVDLSALKSKAKVGFKAEAAVTSDLYIRNITISHKDDSSVDYISPESLGMIKSGEGEIIVTSPVADTMNVYSIDGSVITSVSVTAGETLSIPVSSGVYIVKGIKILVK